MSSISSLLQAGVFERIRAERMGTSDGTAAPPPAGSAADRLQQTRDALRMLSQSAVDRAEERKALAKQKLEEAKAEILMLKQMGFPPEVIARRAAQLAVTLSTAATDFSAASAQTGTAGASAPPATTTAQPDSDAAAEDEPAKLPAAYREAMADGQAQQAKRTEDAKTAADFKATLDELKAMLEKALRDMRASKKNGAGGEAERALGMIGDALSTLTAPPAVTAIPVTGFSMTF